LNFRFGSDLAGRLNAMTIKRLTDVAGGMEPCTFTSTAKQGN
jgi:hypothetical protein